jgi:hypothetical protein
MEQLFFKSTAMDCHSVCGRKAMSFSFKDTEFHKEILPTVRVLESLGFQAVKNHKYTERERER